MIISKISLMTGGILTLLMAIFHCFYPKIFNWEKDFQRITGTNKRIFFTIHMALFLLFFILSIITIIYCNELTKGEGVSFLFLLLISLFWFWRTLWQIIYFKPEKGSKLLYMHFILIIIFFILSISYILPLIVKI